MSDPTPANADVAAFFDALDPPLRRQLLGVRGAILAAAAGLPNPVAVDETLKWGEPSYRLTGKGRGTAVRINHSASGEIVLLFHCKTALVARIRERFGATLAYDSNRAVILRGDQGSDATLIGDLATHSFTYRA